MSLGVLLLNVFLIIVELVLNKHGLPLVLEELLDIASLLCSAYFCAEVSLRVIGYGYVRTNIICSMVYACMHGLFSFET